MPNDESTGQFNGTPDGIDAVAAAMNRNGASGVAVAAQAEPVLLSKSGDAKISVKLDLHACNTPVIVFREQHEGKIGAWLPGTSYGATPALASDCNG